MADVVEIHQLYGASAAALVRRDAPAWVGCFVDGGSVRSAEGTFTGGDRLAEYARDHRLRFLLSGLSVTVDDDTAAAWAQAWGYRIDPAGPPVLQVTGTVADQLVRTALGWRFAVHFHQVDAWAAGRPSAG